MEQIGNYFRRKKYLILRLVFVLGIPIILSIPNFFPRVHKLMAPVEIDANNIDKNIQEVRIDRSTQIFDNTSLFSRLTGLDILPLPIKVCINNRNKLMVDGTEKESFELLDGREGGAMSLKVRPDDKESIEIYAPKDSQICRVINRNTFSNVIVMYSPQIRSVLPVGQAELINENGVLKINVPLYKESSIDIKDTDVTVYTVFNLTIFRNIFIYTLGISLIISLFETLVRFIRWKWN